MRSTNRGGAAPPILGQRSQCHDQAVNDHDDHGHESAKILPLETRRKRPLLGACLTTGCRCLPAVPAPATSTPENESESPEDEPDQQQNPQDVQRSRDESATTQQQQQEYQHDQRSYQFPFNLLSAATPGAQPVVCNEPAGARDYLVAACRMTAERAEVVIRPSTSLGRSSG